MEGSSQARSAGGTRGEIGRAGAGAGALGGVAMMAFMMLAAVLDGSSALDPVGAVGTAFRGDDASRTGIGAVAWGVLLHVVVGAFLGIAFAAIVPRDMPPTSSVMLGAGSALFWMALAVQVLIPRFAPILDVEMPLHGGAWVLAYALFGAVTGIAPSLRRRIGGGAPRREQVARPRPLRPGTSE